VTGSRSALLWYGVVGAPFAWVLQLVVGYGLEEAACSPGSGRWGIDGDVWEVVVSIGAAAAGAAALAAAFASRRNAERAADPSGRVAFMATAGLLADVLFLALIALTTAGVIALGSCEAG